MISIKISWYNTLICIHFHCILLAFAFAFDDFESLLQNLCLIWIGSKFGNFKLEMVKVEKVNIAITQSQIADTVICISRGNSVGKTMDLWS